ncbi:hypothetical protein X747_23245 [Mesorhizobium sp. LNJC384A00]|nr:hypothetical protein X765_31165 [Mesorhizobium sp. LSHC440B00]ESX33489.1 hypothetical protein X763_25800 [Mesorhizobium sp. LSHC432A00]ESX34122.1 hypothetical protein X764_28680 [Mesorhizobium sp. LSHC440A00]ESX80055.1 hypothetical protein X757_04810 [Mesorhizobium sp. LSHC414A00]ESY09191.1 hypothetical protein X752_21385 [Mesorhizobium sp. LNJC398B00]ESY17041.1 hypothetical protein X749_31225 [Mesorhizobium sp. LNJC391B00]ESY39679.1 hypothetical protein X747_23245 [Mesorhizobium sp. LNJC3
MDPGWLRLRALIIDPAVAKTGDCAELSAAVGLVGSTLCDIQIS